MGSHKTVILKLILITFFFGFISLFISPVFAQTSSNKNDSLKIHSDSILKRKKIFNYLIFSTGIANGLYFSVASTTCIANGNHQAGIASGLQYTSVPTPYEGPGDSINIILSHFYVNLSNRYFFTTPGRGLYLELVGGLNFPLSGSYSKMKAPRKSGYIPASLFKNSANFGFSIGSRVLISGESAFIAEVQYRFNPLPMVNYGAYGVHQVGIALGASF